MKQKLLLILGLLVIFTAVPVKSEDDVEALDSTTPLPVEEVKLPEKDRKSTRLNSSHAT